MKPIMCTPLQGMVKKKGVHRFRYDLTEMPELRLENPWFALCGRTGRQADKHPGPAARRGCGAFLRGVWRSGILGEKGVTHGVENEAG